MKTNNTKKMRQDLIMKQKEIEKLTKQQSQLASNTTSTSQPISEPVIIPATYISAINPSNSEAMQSRDHDRKEKDKVIENLQSQVSCLNRNFDDSRKNNDEVRDNHFKKTVEIFKNMMANNLDLSKYALDSVVVGVAAATNGNNRSSTSHFSNT